VLQLKTPPLRLRENDIELLAYYFFNKFAENGLYKAKGLDADAQSLIKNYDWPGNVRQLMNCIRHALVISENRMLTPSDLGIDRRHKVRIMQTLEQARSVAERETIMMCLQKNNNNIQRSAEALNISRVTMYRLVSKYQLKAV
jgi:DNA-binding NtrC family response regulator